MWRHRYRCHVTICQYFYVDDHLSYSAICALFLCTASCVLNVSILIVFSHLTVSLPYLNFSDYWLFS